MEKSEKGTTNREIMECKRPRPIKKLVKWLETKVDKEALIREDGGREWSTIRKTSVKGILNATVVWALTRKSVVLNAYLP